VKSVRPVDLARPRGISTQAVRNYERDGFLPPAARSGAGYRRYGPAHADALDAFLALAAAHGHATAGAAMVAVNRGDLDGALAALDRSHAQLRRDRETLDAVEAAAGVILDAVAPPDPDGPLTIGELAHRLGLGPAALRKWERAGLLRPDRDPVTGHRRYPAAAVRDAQLAHLLRRGGYLLADIAAVLDHLRYATGAEALEASLEAWRARLVARGRAMLGAAGLLAAYLDRVDGGGGP
jgi:DNA-binding transcriptional MerR regulator